MTNAKANCSIGRAWHVPPLHTGDGRTAHTMTQHPPFPGLYATRKLICRWLNASGRLLRTNSMAESGSMLPRSIRAMQTIIGALRSDGRRRQTNKPAKTQHTHSDAPEDRYNTQKETNRYNEIASQQTFSKKGDCMAMTKSSGGTGERASNHTAETYLPRPAMQCRATGSCRSTIFSHDCTTLEGGGVPSGNGSSCATHTGVRQQRLSWT